MKESISDKAKFLLLLMLWAAIFFPVYPGLMAAWFSFSNADNSYGALVPIISLYFAWKSRDRLEKAASSNSVVGLAILVASLVLYVFCFVGGVVVVQRLMLVSSLIGLVVYYWGKEKFSVLAFPLIFLFFMVPPPDSIVNTVSFPLQTYVTVISEKIIRLCEIPVYREGHMLYFAQTQLEVAEACSGIRSMTALLMLSVLFMHLCHKGRMVKSIIIISSVVIAFISNIIRVSGSGVLAHFYGSDVARGFLHEFSGVLVFTIGLLLLFIEYKILNSIEAGKRQEL